MTSTHASKQVGTIETTEAPAASGASAIGSQRPLGSPGQYRSGGGPLGSPVSPSVVALEVSPAVVVLSATVVALVVVEVSAVEVSVVALSLPSASPVSSPQAASSRAPVLRTIKEERREREDMPATINERSRARHCPRSAA